MVIDALSRERLIPYLVAVGHHEKAAIDLYAWSMRLSESFYPLLSVTEVALRNAVANRIREIHGDTWWESKDFHDAIGKTAKGTVLRSRNQRLSEKKYVTHGCMVAELTFGFWTKMLLPKHETKYWSPLHDVFPTLPSSISLADLERRCQDVTILRNRIFHHEPLLGREITRDFAETLELVSWIDPRLSAWIKPQLRIMAVLRERPKART